MLTAECYKQRAWRPTTVCTFLEFNYMLMQSYDFLDADPELRLHGCKWAAMTSGANMLVRRGPHPPQGAVRTHSPCTFKLLLTHDGKKMGKTEKPARCGSTRTRPSPFDFYQYWRNVDDADVEKCLGTAHLPADGRGASIWARCKAARINEAKQRAGITR